MNDLLAALNFLRLRIEEALLAENITMQMRNRKTIIPPDTAWARYSQQHVSSKPACLGALSIRDRGIVVVSLFFPLNSGTYDCDRVSYLLRDSFSEWEYNYLETGVGAVQDVPSTLDYYHVNVYLPYRHK